MIQALKFWHSKYGTWNFILKGTAEKLIEQLKYDGDGLDTYVEDFLLTYRTFVKTTRDITSRLLEWCNDYMLRDKVAAAICDYLSSSYLSSSTTWCLFSYTSLSSDWFSFCGSALRLSTMSSTHSLCGLLISFFQSVMPQHSYLFFRWSFIIHLCMNGEKIKL